MSRVISRAAAEQQREHAAVLARIRGEHGHIGQCAGCPAGHDVLCATCALCSRHCTSDGCGYSPHAWQAYTPDNDTF